VFNVDDTNIEAYTHAHTFAHQHHLCTHTHTHTHAHDTHETRTRHAHAQDTHKIRTRHAQHTHKTRISLKILKILQEFYHQSLILLSFGFHLISRILLMVKSPFRETWKLTIYTQITYSLVNNLYISVLETRNSGFSTQITYSL